MLHLLLVIALDSLPPPTLLAPPQRDTLVVVTENPLQPTKPYTPKEWTRVPPALPKRPIQPVRIGLKILLPFVAGALLGVHETILHHWPAFERRHPNANAQWWNPAKSWRNKYNHGDPKQGRTAVPVQITDAKHLLLTAHNATLFAAGVNIGFGRPKKWWQYTLDIGGSLLSYTVGNFLTYNIIYRPP